MKTTIVIVLVAVIAAIGYVGCKFLSMEPLDKEGMVYEVSDTLNTVEAVVKQVNAVYEFWNQQREHFDENNTKLQSLDERFGTREWQHVVAQADSVTKECECGGFFDFGDEGPLDPWLYDCYEGRVTADSIKAEILPNGMAEVKFLVKDAVTIKGIPMRWLMQVEDDQWRVANIFFVANDNMDLLEGLKAYVSEAKTDKQLDAEHEPNLSDYAE